MNLKEKISNHPTVVFVLMIIAIISIVFTLFNFVYGARIDNYKDKISNQKEKIEELNQQTSQILKELEIKKNEDDSNLGNKTETSEIIEQERLSNVELELIKDKDVYFWNSQARIHLEQTYTALKSISCIGYWGDTKFDYDLKIGERKSFYFNASRFYLDLIKIEDEKALIRITEKE